MQFDYLKNRLQNASSMEGLKKEYQSKVLNTHHATQDTALNCVMQVAHNTFLWYQQSIMYHGYKGASATLVYYFSCMTFTKL